MYKLDLNRSECSQRILTDPGGAYLSHYDVRATGFFLLDGEWNPAGIGSSRVMWAWITLGRSGTRVGDSRVSEQRGKSIQYKVMGR
jgi:hypothetical protein